ncbi:hypothetical protein LR48_Vigan03g239900 [Vigna angularis]|uniref:Uncharacterized protein n=1 Tax=Phaseolus angularis TaxID=3914 RepID=A0A0L9U8R9_PHAAN|nr:hypothetical protein LR48_Vigan03g239900 [Vigna angularis]
MGSCSNLRRGLEEDLSWASGEDEVLALRAGRGSEQLLKFLEDLDLHVWEEMDPKILQRKSTREFLQNARSSNFGESKLDVRPNSARPNSDRPTSERSSNSGEIGRSSKIHSGRAFGFERTSVFVRQVSNMRRSSKSYSELISVRP